VGQVWLAKARDAAFSLIEDNVAQVARHDGDAGVAEASHGIRLRSLSANCWTRGNRNRREGLEFGDTLVRVRQLPY
jgi:hypothetical protein